MHALRDASLQLYPGQITALIGENGAGKSTLVKIACGLHQPDAGSVLLAGEAVRIRSAAHARDLGINVVHQECMVFDNLSVAENIFVGARPTRRRLVAWRDMNRQAAAVLRQLEARFDPTLPAGHLSTAQKHIVQIARALTSEARVLILDEPTAALSHREADDLLRVTRLIRERGCAIAFISHKFEEIFALADRFAVFRDGASVGSGAIAETDREQLVRLMVGREVEPSFAKAQATPGEELLSVENLSRVPEFENVSFSVRCGEILGVYGLVGAGRTELAQTLFGLTQPDAGIIRLQGAAVSINSAADAMEYGLAYVPEDRQAQGAILPFTIADNICLPNLATVSRAGFCSTGREAALAREWIAALGVKTPGPAQKVADLSGGNQQKVVLAKWLARNPRVLILDEPTKGIDVGAKTAVHAVTNGFARRGNAVLMISSELPEILDLSDRILVMRRGRVRALFDREAASAEAIVHAATDESA